jgi:hypothetical protein
VNELTAVFRNFVNVSKSEYGTKSRSSSMAYMYFHVSHAFIFKFITKVSQIQMATAEQVFFYFPYVASTTEWVYAVNSYDKFQIIELDKQL